MKHSTFRTNELKERINCYSCGKDLSKVYLVRYVKEGPICSICVMDRVLNALAAGNKNKDALEVELPPRAQTRVGELL
jgi:hypothetical protein